MARVHTLAIILFTFLVINNAFAQDELLEMLDSISTPEKRYAQGTFQSTRVINAHTVDFQEEGEMQALIQHRFSSLEDGYKQGFGLDNAIVRLGIEYGVKDWLALGFGRSTNDGVVDGYYKTKLVRQSYGAGGFPFSIVTYSNVHFRTKDFPNTQISYKFKHRFSFASQILIAKKFSQAFSIQLMPGYLHRNLVLTNEDPNDIYHLGGAFRLKLTKRVALTGEYFHVFDSHVQDTQEMPLTFGIEIGTAGHVFQLNFSNSPGFSETQFLTQTIDKWSEGGIRFGFNISRVFQIKKEYEPDPELLELLNY